MPKNGWNEYKKLILFELEENKTFRAEMRDILGTLREDMSGLKVKAAIAGGMAGMVGTSLLSYITHLWK